MKNCPTCHHLNERAAEICELCGATLGGQEEPAENPAPVVHQEAAATPASPPPSPDADSTGLTAALLTALEKEKEDGRARGEGPQARGYMLRPLPMPKEGPAPTLGRRAPSAVTSAPAQAAPSQDRSAASPAPTAADALVCPYCQTVNPPNNRFCGGCGARMPAQAEPSVGAARAPSAPHAAVAARPSVSLICINEDGTDGAVIPMNQNQKVVGRSTDPRFGADAFLSPQHARLVMDSDGLFIEDLKSLNGTFLRIRDTVPLGNGDCFLMGRQVLRLEKLGHQIDPKARSADGTRYMGSPIPSGQYRLVQVGIGGVTQNVYCIGAGGAVLGRERGGITFPADKFMSAKHARILLTDGENVTLSDLNSSNGTWLRLSGRHRLEDDDFVFLGQQLFRVQIE